jgi:dihydroorotase-like cyclic amidohydrolase
MLTPALALPACRPFMGDVACDDFFTGQAAALAGGTTYHIDFALPVDHDLIKGWEAWQVRREKAVRATGQANMLPCSSISLLGMLNTPSQQLSLHLFCPAVWAQVKGQQGCMDYSFHMAVTNWNDKVG